MVGESFGMVQVWVGMEWFWNGLEMAWDDLGVGTRQDCRRPEPVFGDVNWFVGDGNIYIYKCMIAGKCFDNIE